jgi:cobalt/nickel transport system permease protein
MYFQPFFPKPEALHIPDGFLSLPVALVSWVITLILLAIAVRKSQNQLSERQVPLMGVMAAFVFAAQMINFPVVGGTSGHFLGGALVAIVLGPWAGILVMASVVGVQALLFQDGGLLVMGANILNMGLLTALIGYGLYRAVAKQKRGIRMLVAGSGAWLAIMAGALSTAIQLWLSGTSPANFVFPAMIGIHALIGIGEALITVAALTFIEQVRPELLRNENLQARGGLGWVVGGVVISLVVVLLSPFASGDPDGLERVAADLGFIGQGKDAPFQILSDYSIPFLNDAGLSTILAGTIGAIMVAVAVFLVGKALYRKSGTSTQVN